MLVRAESRWCVAVRRPDGSIHVECDTIEERWPRLRASVLRGPLILVESVAIGMRAISIALRTSTGEPVGDQAVGAVLAPVVVGIVGVFIALPGMLTAGLPAPAADITEAVARAAMLLIYLLLISRSATSQRLFGYHGAEHMAIAAFERHGRMPTSDESRAESPVHVRCGTDFLALFVIVCGVVFSFVTRTPVWAGGLVRVALLPVVAAVAYEVMRLCARAPHSIWARLVTWPGRMLQRITTRPPDDGQLEVAMAALRAAADDDR